MHLAKWEKYSEHKHFLLFPRLLQYIFFLKKKKNLYQAPKGADFRKHRGKKENMLVTSVLQHASNRHVLLSHSVKIKFNSFTTD